MEIIDIADKTQWDGFVAARPETNFLQSYAWGEFHKALKRPILRRALVQNGKIIAAYTGYVEPAKRGKHLAIAGGPILDWQNQEIIHQIFADIKSEALKLEVDFVRVRPQIEESRDHEALFRSLGLRPAPLYLSVETAGVLDLNQSEDEILKNASQNLRRALRKSEKAGVTIETTTSPARIEEFYRIEQETAKRQGFVPFSEEFLREQFAAFTREDQAILYVAKWQGQILAENFMVFYGNEASYHYGVSSEAGTKISGAPLLHLAAMREARDRGIKRYNFWGIVGENDTKHRFYGVSRFKRSFGVQEVHYLHAHDLVLNKLSYYFRTLPTELWRKLIRHI